MQYLIASYFTSITLGCVLLSSTAVAGEIRWARGTANGNHVGEFSDVANWDGGVVPAAGDRARVDRGGTVMRINSRIVVDDFLFGVNEPGQTFNFSSNADVTLKSNCMIAHNRGDVTANLAKGAKLTIGGSLILGQDDNRGNDDEDITVNIDGSVDIGGGIIFGLCYNGDVSDVDLLINISGSVKANEILIANDTVSGGDADAFFAKHLNNSAKINFAPTGRLTLFGKKIDQAKQLVADGILVSDIPDASLDIRFNGTDIVIKVMPEPRSPPQPRSFYWAGF